MLGAAGEEVEREERENKGHVYRWHKCFLLLFHTVAQCKDYMR